MPENKSKKLNKFVSKLKKKLKQFTTLQLKLVIMLLQTNRLTTLTKSTIVLIKTKLIVPLIL